MLFLRPAYLIINGQPIWTLSSLMGTGRTDAWGKTPTFRACADNSPVGNRKS